ncbi:MAG: outer membrane protein assembly factor BamC, partial [Burkholderiaceae bacterium]
SLRRGGLSATMSAEPRSDPPDAPSTSHTDVRGVSARWLSQTSARARLVGAAQAPSGLEIDDNFDRAWRRVGLALDRTGFTVEDRDRAKGTYFVRYVEPADPKAKEPGMLSKLFSSSKPDAKPQQYRIQLQGANDRLTTLVVQNAQGAADVSPTAARILALLADDLQ